jgi:hypothetical protein
MATRVLRPISHLPIYRLGSITRPTLSVQFQFLSTVSPLRPLSTTVTSQLQSQSSKPLPANMSIDALIQAAQNRRSIHKLGKNSTVSDAKIEELVNAAILNVPSAFNTQSTRLVVLLKDEHERLWDIAASVFEGLVASGRVPEETFKNQTLPKLQMFKAAFGTVCHTLHTPAF